MTPEGKHCCLLALKETGMDAVVPAGFAVCLVIITAAYAVLTVYASWNWQALAPRTATLEEAELDLRHRFKAKQQFRARGGLRGSLTDGHGDLGLVDDFNESMRERSDRDTHLPLRIARSRVACHAPILPSTQAAQDAFHDAREGHQPRHALPRPTINEAAPSPFDMTPSAVIASGALRHLPATVAIPLLSSPAPHNRWRGERAVLVCAPTAGNGADAEDDEPEAGISVAELQHLQIGERSPSNGPGRSGSPRRSGARVGASSLRDVLSRFNGGAGSLSLEPESPIIVLRTEGGPEIDPLEAAEL
jgi:hypothetical protein